MTPKEKREAIIRANAVIIELGAKFDSHDFIKAYIKAYPLHYMAKLDINRILWEAVWDADSQMAIFLKNNQSDLSIKLVSEDKVNSENILGNVSPCSEWEKVL